MRWIWYMSFWSMSRCWVVLDMKIGFWLGSSRCVFYFGNEHKNTLIPVRFEPNSLWSMRSMKSVEILDPREFGSVPSKGQWAIYLQIRHFLQKTVVNYLSVNAKIDMENSVPCLAITLCSPYARTPERGTWLVRSRNPTLSLNFVLHYFRLKFERN